MADYKVCEFDDPDEAAQFEMDAIETFKPKHNVFGRTKGHCRYDPNRGFVSDFSFLAIEAENISKLFQHMCRVLSQFSEEELGEIARDAENSVAAMRAARGTN